MGGVRGDDILNFYYAKVISKRKKSIAYLTTVWLHNVQVSFLKYTNSFCFKQSYFFYVNEENSILSLKHLFVTIWEVFLELVQNVAVWFLIRFKSHVGWLIKTLDQYNILF